MKKGYLLIFLIVIVGLMLFSSACAPTRIPVEEVDRIPTPGSSDQEPAAPGNEPGSGEDQQPAEPTKPAEPVSEFPEDIPIMEGAYDVQSVRKGQIVTFQIDSEIQAVVKYYQDELPNYGWDIQGPPDSAIGSIATMSRENEAGDTLAINMQYNQLGGFVKVQLTLARVE